MSHTVTIKTQVRNLALLKAACQAMGLPFQEGEHIAKAYETRTLTKFSFTPEGWTFPVAVKDDGEMAFDNYKGSWGNIDKLHAVLQEYALRVAENESQELLMQGWTMERVMQPNGDMQLVLTQ